MKYVDEFRNRRLIDKLAGRIRDTVDMGRTYNFMEVCGTHTMSIFRYGLKDILPDNINLISGPGCPVCVTPNDFLDRAIWLSNRENVIIATFGDMLRVPGSYSSLEKERAMGNRIKIVYSSLDALAMAKKYPDKEVVFLGVGFETTAPTTAVSIFLAQKERIKNYSVLCAHKTMPEALQALVCDKKTDIDGFILPGHVSAIIGSRPYRFLKTRYRIGGVVAGFEPLDILEAILMMVKQDSPKLEIQYTRVITPGGNEIAQKSINKIFKKADSLWRGIGRVAESGLKIREIFSRYDAESRFNIRIAPPKENKNCACGDVLKGIKIPPDCRLYKKVCSPDNPVGACMVSSEGTCAAWIKYC